MGDMVSVVIPVYNTSKYVLDTIKSVIDQNYKNIEIIVINDGSTDDSMIKIESKYGKYINLIDLKKNLGVSNARNIGIRESKGSYIAFIDSDDLWVSDKINKQVSVFENNDKIGVCYTGRYIIKKNGVIIKNENKLYGGDVFNKIIVRNFICLSSVIVRRECFDYCGFFDETLKVSEDYDLWIRISSSYNFFCINEPMVYYRITPNSLTKDEKKNDNKCTLCFFKKYA